MKGRPPSFLFVALLAAGLVACSSSPPATSPAELRSLPASAAGSGAPASAGQASPAGSVGPGDADLYGTIQYTDHSRRESAPGDLHQESDSTFTATINVRMIEDPAGPEGSLITFVDAGSTYTFASHWHTEQALGCGLGATDFSSDPDLAAEAGTFVPDEQRIPLAPGASISAQIDRTLASYTLFADIAYGYSADRNACAGGPLDTAGEVAGGPLICGDGFFVFGLSGSLIEDPNGPDTLDMSCSFGDAVNGTEVTGTLTLFD